MKYQPKQDGGPGNSTLYIKAESLRTRIDLSWHARTGVKCLTFSPCSKANEKKKSLPKFQYLAGDETKTMYRKISKV